MVDQANPLGSQMARAPVMQLAAAASPPASDRVQAKALDPKPVRPTAPASKPSRPEVEAAAKEVEGFLNKTGSLLELKESKVDSMYADLAFQVDQDSGIPFFKVIDSSTKKVIRQIPSEEVIAMARKLRELSGPKDAAGVLMNEEG